MRRLRLRAPAGLDEEAERELWLLKLEHAVIRSVDQLGCLRQEQEILLLMHRRRDADLDDEALAHERALPDAAHGWT